MEVVIIAEVGYYCRSRLLSPAMAVIAEVGLRAEDVGCVIADVGCVIADVGCVTRVYVPASGARKAPGLTRGGKERAEGGGLHLAAPLTSQARYCRPHRRAGVPPAAWMGWSWC
jgi:hypothetical protein